MTNAAFPKAETIEASLELLAELCDDPTPHIYQELFRVHPYMESYFWRDTDGAIKGEMLSRTFEAILDFIGPRRYAAMMIGTEMVTHEGYDVPREVFITFFVVIRDVMRTIIGDAWEPDIDEAWQELLRDIQYFADITPRSDPNSAHSREVHARLEAAGMKTR